MGLALLQGKSIQQPSELPVGDWPRLPAGRPGEAAFFQTFVVKPEPGVVPVQNFQFVLPAVAEHEEG